MRRNIFVLLLLLLCLCSCATEATPPPVIEPEEHWIEVDVSLQVVRLHDGSQIIGEYPAATGVNSSPETTTYTGLFTVQQLLKGPIESVPGVYVKDVVIFDVVHGNGFHSQPMDENGHILDETLGKPATAGCVRVGESALVFDFARPGMKIWVH